MRIIKFKLFEANNKDINDISKNFNEYFTISFEFEVETVDRTNMKIDFTEIDEDSIDDIISIVHSSKNIRKQSEKSLVSNLIYEIYDNIEYDTISIDIFNKILEDKSYTNRELEIVSFLKSTIMSFISVEDLMYLKKNFISKLPNFCKKWRKKLDFVGDATLDRGIEVKPKTYTNSISEAIELINDFYNDFESQDYWKFTDQTGLHINIGTKQASKWNPIKGLLILNDHSDSNIPLVFKDMTNRMNNRFCGSLIQAIKGSIKKDIIDIKNIDKTEEKINTFLQSRIKKLGVKNFGFNITRISDNYVEFRYAGSNINKNILIEKLKYFSFVVYTMTNIDYKRKEYLKKLYKFITEL